MANQDIIKIIREHKTTLFKKYNIVSLGIFGSYARNEETIDSDVDIVVEFSDYPGLFKYMEIEREIEKILSKKVDLVEKYSIRKELEESILNEVILI